MSKEKKTAEEFLESKYPIKFRDMQQVSGRVNFSRPDIIYLMEAYKDQSKGVDVGGISSRFNKLISEQKDINPEFVKIVNDNFFDLISNHPTTKQDNSDNKLTLKEKSKMDFEQYSDDCFDATGEYLSETDIFICECSSLEHLAKFWYDKKNNILYIEQTLSTHRNFFKRLWVGIKYAFGYKSRFGMWDEYIFSEENTKKLLDFLNENRYKTYPHCEGWIDQYLEEDRKEKWDRLSDKIKP